MWHQMFLFIAPTTAGKVHKEVNTTWLWQKKPAGKMCSIKNKAANIVDFVEYNVNN